MAPQVLLDSRIWTRPTKRLERLEPGRPIADRRVFDSVREHKFSAADFTITAKGTSRLNPDLARIVAGITSPEAAKNRHWIDPQIGDHR